jgi:hypothetical protein
MFASAWYSAYYNPLGFGRRFHDQSYVCQTSMRVIADAGGHE